MSELSEFSLIKQYFENSTVERDDVLLGIGDDCAIVQSKTHQQIAISVDTLVEGIHFLPNTDPESLGHKSLAVSLSDLAAMGGHARVVYISFDVTRSECGLAGRFCQGLSQFSNST